MHLEYNNALVTGAAGFIGFHLSKRLLDEGYRVFGVDNLNNYYDPQLKLDRLRSLKTYPAFSLTGPTSRMQTTLKRSSGRIPHRGGGEPRRTSRCEIFAYQSSAYVDSNLVGFVNILECCRHHGVKHLVFASSSSVYGANTNMPFSVHHNVDHPVSLYAASKKSNELMAHTYSHLFGMACTGLRFFTVYGPWGRPDMALFLFTKAILAANPSMCSTTVK
jgi:UDP-glucuronate 4-epimerase